MRVDNCEVQLRLAAERAGLIGLFGAVSFAPEDVRAVEEAEAGEPLPVRFAKASGPIGTMYVDVYDGGNPEDAGLTVGLRGWLLDDGTASV